MAFHSFPYWTIEGTMSQYSNISFMATNASVALILIDIPRIRINFSKMYSQLESKENYLPRSILGNILAFSFFVLRSLHEFSPYSLHCIQYQFQFHCWLTTHFHFIPKCYGLSHISPLYNLSHSC